ncbi:TPA: hypothetical protein ACKPYB_000211 [Stenotrophomonas maltophilia]|uniref:hypothetical protein n=1 Tax=Stenotrophomonas TaxID=40323 RepID=UPI001AA1AB28|nr:MULTISPECIES: hypothetical protein [Stenotrophomonas]ELF4108264.1 hypothetical protein [Stenotrophomonas maltophilia]MBO1745778.1 hypothetical protein [Stenotrophomonas maltophilia]WAP03975.1 hypothetical protein FQS62_011020 [Stenotrophomonas sp. SBJS02]HEA4091472.1 hypothetical protein [Stenotrophomonas maltophilia]HEA4095981.1 hypothetical protein [Stenotrophomonas maltophilia]
MFDAISSFALLGAIVAISIGAARIVSWLLDRRDYTASQQSREAQVIALAEAEIAATKRGDLLAAARYAEQHEAGRA